MPLYAVWGVGPFWRWKIGRDWTGWALSKRGAKAAARRSLRLDRWSAAPD
jgi:hypothetical protein